MFKVNIDYEKEPKAIINFMGVKKDIYPYLTVTQQKRINKDYNLTIDLNISHAILRKAMPHEWKQYLKLRRYIIKVVRQDLYNFKKMNEYRKKIKKDVIKSQNILKNVFSVKKNLKQSEKINYTALIIAG